VEEKEIIMNIVNEIVNWAETSRVHFETQYLYPVGQMGKEKLNWLRMTTHPTMESAETMMNEIIERRNNTNKDGKVAGYRIVKVEQFITLIKDYEMHSAD
jgi:hypothetical protein